MNSPVQRLLSVHMAALHQPDVFARSVFITCEIEEACEKAKQQAMALKIGRVTRSTAGMLAAAETLERQLRQAATLNDSLRRVLEQDRTASVLDAALGPCAGEGEV